MPRPWVWTAGSSCAWARSGPRSRPTNDSNVVVSNPPYVAAHEAAELPLEVSQWEPPGALFGGADGLDLVRGIIGGAPGRLRPGGLLALEIGANQGPAVLGIMEAQGGAWGAARILKDLAARDRVLLAEAQ